MHILLFGLKALALFLLLLLFINPTIKNKTLENTKPILSVLVDNSKSIPFFKAEKQINSFVEVIDNDTELNDKFEIQKLNFGSSLNNNDSLSFNENETNIYKAIRLTNELNKDKIAPVLLLSDGNQTIGNDYEFLNSKQNIFPVVFGDTTKYKDLKLSQLNVNKYSYIKNKFPVEAFLNYEGKENVTTRFFIYNKGKVVFTKRINFTAEENSKIITTNLISTKEGLQYYRASIQKIEGEKNTKNNSKSFSIEVIDEQTKVLLLSSINHPDLGAFKKAIESNKQRSVTISLINNFKENLTDYQLVVLYQPNNNFTAVFNQILAKNSNYLLVSGANTDWNFINNKQIGITKKAINQTENYGAIFNNGFLTFLQKDIGFSQFAPLKDKFGEIIISKENQVLLYQNINGVQTKQPLLLTSEKNNQKTAFLLGEGIWKWRANSFLNSNSFQDFDGFIGNLVQYLASNKKRSRLEVNANPLYTANSVVKIAAFYTDKNYIFDARAALEITITNSETKKTTTFPFSLVNKSYQIEVENLVSGEYSYKVSVAGQNINKYGKFKITDYLIEEQFTNANTTKLQNLAEKTGGKLYYASEFEKIKNDLLQNKTFYTVQKSTIKEQNLIDWKWILFLIILLLASEWFVRKYYGKI
ncbi:MAG: VWA domain-containing protein [Polaribacter sp.]